MDFIDQVKQFSQRVNGLKDNLQTEEATKVSLIMPFFSMLGYDVFNPDEFIPEFTADVGIKKGEKVDYAIVIDGDPTILVEAKSVNEDLDRHGSQLFRYFGTTTAKFGILTNGIIYRFFTDLDAPNKMDDRPFLEINILDIKESQVPEIKKFCKASFDASEIFDSASDLKYSYEFKNKLASELQSPSDDFVRFFLNGTYSGRMTQNIIDRFRDVVKRSLNSYISELMNDKIKVALRANDDPKEESADDTDEEPEEVAHNTRIVTTTEELGAFFIIKSILSEVVPTDDITYKDTVNYMNILYKGNSRKWICRLIIRDTSKVLIIPDSSKHEEKYTIESIYDLNKYKEPLIESLKNYIE